MRQTYFITGTDTGVGKTVLTALLTAFLRGRGRSVAAFKPVCAGGRADARTLHIALGGTLTLDEINPWCFRAPVAPALAAKLEKKMVTLAEVVAHIRTVRKDADVTLVEGAGGLLSPLGKDFDSRDLLAALRATPVIVGSNRIGVVNQVLLTLAALPRRAAAAAHVMLMSPPKPDASTKTNAGLIAELAATKEIFELPWLGPKPMAGKVLADSRVRQGLRRFMTI